MIASHREGSAMRIWPTSVWMAAFLGAATLAAAQVGEVRKLAPDVYFHEGDIKGKGHCNNGWVVFEDYVLVIDANFPSGAREIIPRIRALTDKPIRFAFDTHHHGDHAYGNQVWVEEGATPVAHTGVVEEMKKYETGLFGGGKPGRWEDAAKEREDVRASKLKPPSVLFPDTLIFDDGIHRVELRYLGVAHTHGDGFAWLPREKILFTGDATVNGAYNYVGDGNVAEWIRTLDRARDLGAQQVGPGHGPYGTGALLEDQQLFFKELYRVVRAAAEGKSAAEVQSSVEKLEAELTANTRIARYVGSGFASQVAKVYNEITGQSFPDRRAEAEAQRVHLARHHGEGEGAERRHPGHSH
jgi:glyoxylase-like metal-dependent hydrolase (beta-lactamase superfamily II)